MSTTSQSPCGHAHGESLYGALLSRCADCGLVRTAANPRFHYDTSYFTEVGKGGYDFDTPFARAHDEARFESELARLERGGLKGSVLDVGCATGSFLLYAQRRGWSVAGVEIAEYARSLAERRLGVPLATSLDELPSSGRYDLVTLHHVLEHIEDPQPFLQAIRPRVGRRLLIEVPNFDSLAARAHGPRWRDLRPDQHLFHYTRQTLPPLLRRAGFTPLEVYTLWEPLWSMRTALDLLLQLRGLLGRNDEAAASAKAPVAVSDVDSYRPPAGLKAVAVELSRWAARPLVWGLERAGLGERLVVVAEPSAEGAQRRAA
jgi:SAM-dependent methyltransferase